MISSGYSIDLYCDCNDCVTYREGAIFSCPDPVQFAGETYRECATQARNAGWTISKDRTTCYAPNHKVKP